MTRSLTRPAVPLGALLACLLCVAAIAFPRGAAAQPPSNDSCARAIHIDEGIYTGTTIGATVDGVASCGASNATPDVWYVYHPSCTGLMTVDTCLGTVGQDTVLSVYAGTCGNLTELDCNDDACNVYLSQVSVPVRRGLEYYIRVSGYNGATQSFRLRTACTIPNDNCAGALPLQERLVESGSTVGATVDGSSTCGFSNGTPDVWFAYTSPRNGVMVVQTGGSRLDTVISVHSACPGTTANQVAEGCNDDDPTDYSALYPRTPYASLVAVRAVAGATYYVRVSGYNGDVGDFYLVAWTVPDQNACASALELDWRDIIFTYVPIVGSTAFSTVDGSSSCGFSDNAPDNWYTFVSPCFGHVTIDTCSSAFDTVLSVHSGCPGTTDNELVGMCSDDACGPNGRSSRLNILVYRGERYWVRVSGYNGAQGLYLLSVRRWPEHANDDCPGALPAYTGANPISTCGAYTNNPAYEPCLIGGQELIADLWYRYTATCAGRVTVSLCGASFQSLLAIYNGTCPTAAGQAIACDGGACPDGNASVSFPAQAGQSFLIRVAAGPELEFSRGDGELLIACGSPADMNGDGQVNVADYLAYLARFAAADPTADLTGDGRVDVRDYLRFLQYYSS
jgi:hypothetical protein